MKKSKRPRFYEQYKLFFKHHVFQPLGSICHMAACRSFSESIGKMSLILVFNKFSPWAHTELELDVLTAFEICSSLVQKKKLKKNYFSSHKLPKQQFTNFWSQGILEIKTKHIIGMSLLQLNTFICLQWSLQMFTYLQINNCFSCCS